MTKLNEATSLVQQINRWDREMKAWARNIMFLELGGKLVRENKGDAKQCLAIFKKEDIYANVRNQIHQIVYPVTGLAGEEKLVMLKKASSRLAWLHQILYQMKGFDLMYDFLVESKPRQLRSKVVKRSPSTSPFRDLMGVGYSDAGGVTAASPANFR